MHRIDELRRLASLGAIARGRDRLNTSQLEQDFLQYSFHIPRPALVVHSPVLYPLSGDECDHYSRGLTSRGLAPVIPSAIDISGAGSVDSPLDLILFVSAEQIHADHIDMLRSYLNPLIEKIYSEGRSLLEQFALHEVLTGKVEMSRADLPLAHVPLLPHQFTPGAYLLSTTLDTPARSVAEFHQLDQLLQEFAQEPQRNLSDSNKVQQATAIALRLRKNLGALSRYAVQSPCFTTETNSCVLRMPDATLFYLYNGQRNFVITFGTSPFSGDMPSTLGVLDGDAHEETLAVLVNNGFYAPSRAVLRQRIADLTGLYTAAAAHGSSNGSEFSRLLESLRSANAYLENTKNPDMQRSYILQGPPELLEFMICPTTPDPLVHELLPRLSWNSALRSYRRTERFLRQFAAADEDRRRALLNGVVANLHFHNQQNNDVNVLLFTHYHDFCESTGITFRVADR